MVLELALCDERLVALTAREVRKKPVHLKQR